MPSQNNTTSTNSVKYYVIFQSVLGLYFYKMIYYEIYYPNILIALTFLLKKKIPTPHKIIRSVINNDSLNPTRIRKVHIPAGESSAVCRNEALPTTIRHTFPFAINSFFATGITVERILWICESKQSKVLCKRKVGGYSRNDRLFVCLFVSLFVCNTW